MKKLLPFIILFFCFPSFGQTSKCTMKASQLPAIRGLKLNMTKQQVLKLYPKLVLKKTTFNPLGDALQGFIYRKQILNPTFAKNIESIRFIFHDTTLSWIDFNYDDSITWASPKEFIEQITASFNIMPDKWSVLSKDGLSYFVFCADFDLTATVPETGKAQLSISQSIDKILESNDKKKKEFKP